MPARKSAKQSPRRVVVARGDLDTKSCAGRKTTTAFGSGKKRQQLQLQTCCRYLMDVLDNGFARSHADPKRLLKPFMVKLHDELKRDALFDYCYVQFDLTKAEVDTLRNFSRRMIRSKGTPKETRAK